MNIIILGHRGMGATSRLYVNKFLPCHVIPENTLLAFQTAIDNGAQGIEFDVYATQDGEVVVSRDNILDRNVDGYHSCWNASDVPQLGKISEKTLIELQDPKYCLGQNQLIPTLRSVIDLIIRNNKISNKPKLKINIELQGENLLLPNYTWAIVREYILNPENNLDVHDFVVNSFNLALLSKFRAVQQDDALQFMAQGQNIYDLELMLGVYTYPLFGKEELLPGWIPVLMTDGKPQLDEQGSVIPKNLVDESYVQQLITTAKQHHINYLDIISSDLRANLLNMCVEQHMNLSMAFNLVRARAESDVWCNNPNAPTISDTALEQIQLQQLFLFAQQYPTTTFYYKADEVKTALEFINFLSINFSAPQENKSSAEAELNSTLVSFSGSKQQEERLSPRKVPAIPTNHRVI